MPSENQRIGEYVLIDRIGQGAFGEVWRARHHAWADQIVAIKIPTDPLFVRNFQREGHAVHRFSRPNIVKAIAFDPYGDPPYLVMEYVPGTSLRTLIQRGPMAPEHSVAVMMQVLDALHHAHKRGVIHRDIKPENILIHEAAEKKNFDMGTVKLTDFGSGRVATQGQNTMVFTEDRQTGRIVGSQQYMAPEQMEGGEVDARADLYSCGVVFFEMLTGHRPAGMELPSDVNPAVPAALDEVFRRAFARPERRFASAEEFFVSLKQGVAEPSPAPSIPERQSSLAEDSLVALGRAVAVSPEPLLPEPSARKPGNRRIVFAAAGVAVITVVILVGFILFQSSAKSPATIAMQPPALPIAPLPVTPAAQPQAIPKARPPVILTPQSPAMPPAQPPAPPTAAPPPTASVQQEAAFTKSIGMRFVSIPAGEFDMGSPVTEAGHKDDEILHHVKITKPFLMATTTVTVAQWKAVMGSRISFPEVPSDDCPVLVWWQDALRFCEKLSERDGKHYRLPTEAEWEYACRAGTQTPYGGTNNLDEMGWYKGNSEGEAHPVGQKKPNAWGLYDMHGNCWQWCSDFYGPYPAGDAVDPAGPSVGNKYGGHVTRGGSWGSFWPDLSRSASRLNSAPDFNSRSGVDRGTSAGFRVAVDSATGQAAN